MMKEDIKKVLYAYETLSDKESRDKYDQSPSHSDEIQEIVRNMTEQPEVGPKEMFATQGIRKLGQRDDKLDKNMIYWSYKILKSVFLIITVPKIAYIAYNYSIYGVNPF